jgi:predicted transcriptional regulator
MSRRLTDAELDLMEALWAHGPSTVREVWSRLPPGRAYTTIATELGILVDKGWVQSERSGKSFVYTPLIPRDAYVRSGARDLLRRLFGGSVTALVRSLTDDPALTPEERVALQAELRAFQDPPS